MKSSVNRQYIYRYLTRRTLQRYKYLPDKAAEAVELVLKQAETLSNSWSKK